MNPFYCLRAAPAVYGLIYYAANDTTQMSRGFFLSDARAFPIYLLPFGRIPIIKSVTNGDINIQLHSFMET